MVPTVLFCVGDSYLTVARLSPFGTYTKNCQSLSITGLTNDAYNGGEVRGRTRNKY